MTLQLYLTPLAGETSDDATDQIGSQVQQAGLLDTGGTSVENIATENVDFRKRGRLQYGATLSKKAAAELDSLSASAYTTLPLYDDDPATQARKRGYYEVTRIDVAPAQEARDDAYTYDAQLTLAGTREDSRRAVRTNPQAIDSVYSDATTAALVAIPDAATDVRWYDEASGTEPATAVATAEAQYGTVARYDPADASFAQPTLTYDLAFESDGPTDVRVYDSRDAVKFAATASGGEVNVWTHVFDESYQFDGAAVIDTGKFRLLLNGDAQAALDYDTLTARTVASGTTDTVTAGTTETDTTLTVEDETATFVVEDTATHRLTGEVREDVIAQRYAVTTDDWRNVTLDTTSPWSLQVWSIERVRPARVRVRTRWSDGSTEAVVDAIAERGADNLVWVTPENASAPPQGLVDLLQPIARPTDQLAFGTQGLIDRSTRDA